MKTCHIFCAAGFSGLLESPAPDDLIFAADGGLCHTRALGLTPDCVLGDFDSLGYTPQGPEVNRFPVEKDDTDSMLAIKLGLSQGCSRFLLYGAMDGPRLDHTIANLQALSYLASHKAFGYLVGERYLATVLSPGALSFGPEARGILSVFCLGADARGVTLRGLQYPLTDARLTADFPLGVSNHFMGVPSQISLASGRLLILWDRACGLPLAHTTKGASAHRNGTKET